MSSCKQLNNQWSEEDIQMLLESMDKNLPPKDRQTFIITQSQMDWEKIAFREFSGEMCKKKWLEISNHLQKYRTMRELILEAQQHVRMLERKAFKELPDFPKKPLTAYFRFYKENYREYTLKNPTLSKPGLTKLLAKQYKELPEEVKEKYVQDFKKENEEFKRKMAQFTRDHPHLIFQKNSKRPVVRKRHQEEARKHSPGNVNKMKSSKETYGFSKETKLHREPKKPPLNGYHKFHQDLWSSKQLQHLNTKDRMVEISRMWQRTPKSLKDHFKEQAEHMEKQYRVDLDRWLNSLSPTEYTAYRKRTYSKRLNMSMKGGSSPQIRLPSQSPPERSLQERPGEMKLEVPGTDSSVTHPLQSFSVPAKKEDEEKLTSSDSSESNSESESESENESESSGDSESSSSSEEGDNTHSGL